MENLDIIQSQEYFLFKKVILNFVFGVIDVIWETRNFNLINPEQIGYEFSKNKNFWNITIPIKRSGGPVNIYGLKLLLQMPEVTCFGLCIGLGHEDTVDEYIYALGLFQTNLNVEDSKLKNNKILDEDHMNQTILLLCRKISSTGTAKIIQHFGFEPEWIHTSRDDQKYSALQNKSKKLIFAGQKRFIFEDELDSEEDSELEEIENK